MDTKNFQEKGKKVFNNVTGTIEEKGKQVIHKINDMVEPQASEITEEAIHKAVDQAVDVLKIASERVREKDIPTENVTLTVNGGVPGIISFTIQADVPTQQQVQEF